jgi:hypothetical protein
MPDVTLLPPRPTREALIRFFTEQEPLPLRYAADLLGWPWRQLQLEVQDVGGALLSDERVSWVEVAFRLINAWPRRWLLETLGEASVILPPGTPSDPCELGTPHLPHARDGASGRVRAASSSRRAWNRCRRLRL